MPFGSEVVLGPAMCATIVLLCLWAVACGGSEAPAGVRSTRDDAVASGRPGVDGAKSGQGLRGDEDDDDTRANYTGSTRYDNDTDYDNDRIDREPNKYYDEDDASARAYGRAPSVGEARALSAVAERYFGAAAGGDGVRACSMLVPAQVKAIPLDYGRPPGPAYLRGGTCAVVMSRMFEHMHARLAGPVVVTDVRVLGSQAHVLVGSPTMAAVYLTLQREDGVWRVADLLGSSLP